MCLTGLLYLHWENFFPNQEDIAGDNTRSMLPMHLLHWFRLLHMQLQPLKHHYISKDNTLNPNVKTNY